MKSGNWFILMAAVVFFVACQVSAAVFDHFNDGQLDPAWNVVFDNATDWTYQETGTNLNVTAVSGTHPGADEWNIVKIQQDFVTTGDFEVGCNFSWDSEGSITTIQDIFVSLYSNNQALAIPVVTTMRGYRIVVKK